MKTVEERTVRLWRDYAGEKIVEATAGEHYAKVHCDNGKSASARELREVGEAFIEAADFIESTHKYKSVSSMEEAEQLVRKLFRESPKIEVTPKETREYIEKCYDTKLATSTCSRILAELVRRNLLERVKEDHTYVYYVPSRSGL